MTPVVLILGGSTLAALGIWLHRRLRAAGGEYAGEGTTPGERVARDMTTGRALMHAWVLVVLGAAGIGHGLFMVARQVAQ